jgi:hypothetical protein
MRFLCLILFLTALPGFAGSSPEMVFNDLNDIPRRPLEPADKIASVLVFYWQDCPVSNGYAPELNRIAATHTNFAFYIVQVDPDLTPAAAREHARKFDLRAPVLLDPQHRLVKFARATATPEAVVIGRNGRILYRGRIDDHYAALEKKRAEATEHDLIDVLDNLAAGKPPGKTETQVMGCLIQ